MHGIFSIFRFVKSSFALVINPSNNSIDIDQGNSQEQPGVAANFSQHANPGIVQYSLFHLKEHLRLVPIYCMS